MGLLLPAGTNTTRRRALLYVVHEYPPIVGGAGILVRDLVAQMRKETPVVVLTASPDRQTKVEESGDCLIVRVGLPFRHPQYHYATTKSVVVFALKALWHGWRLRRRFTFRVVHGFFVVPAGFVAVLLGWLLRIPSFVSIIAGEVYPAEDKKRLYSTWYYRRVIAWVMRHAGRVVAISGAVRDISRTYYDRREIPIVPPGIDPPVSPPTLRPHEGFVLGSLCRLYPIKGLELVIEALAELRDVDVRFEIVGDGVSRESLQELARQLGVLDRVTFHGFVNPNRKYEILAGCDVFALTSHHEGFPLTLLEAMYLGLPLIATESGGHMDYFVDREHGILLRTRNVQELAQAIRRLMNDAAARQRMSARNRETVQRYLMHNLKDEYLAHYDEPGEASRSPAGSS